MSPVSARAKSQFVVLQNILAVHTHTHTHTHIHVHTHTHIHTHTHTHAHTHTHTHTHTHIYNEYNIRNDATRWQMLISINVTSSSSALAFTVFEILTFEFKVRV